MKAQEDIMQLLKKWVLKDSYGNETR